ncbi:MAG: hypothetical protein BWY70_00044 [Bacteroidetes bacterium ADurb.Bin408]|nr:MAG: hypothetical protein BWY70_00044 [Bacteroidetes bacterium ADurb.Bin408]
MPGLTQRILYIHPDINTLISSEKSCVIAFEKANAVVVLNANQSILKLMTFDTDNVPFAALSKCDFLPVYEAASGAEKVTVVCASEKETLIPDNLFDESMLASYINFNYGQLNGEMVLYDKIEGAGITQVYALPQHLYAYVKEAFPQAALRNRKSIMIELCRNLNEKSKSGFVFVKEGQFDICVFAYKKLLLCNTFSYPSAQDFIYYLMHTLKQLNCDPDTMPLYLYGTIEEESAVYSYIIKYIRHVSFLKKPENIILGATEVPYHYYYDLFTV